MRHIMDEIPEDMQATERERNARYIDRTFKCKVCGKVWAQPVVHTGFRGNTITCPYCEDKNDAKLRAMRMTKG